MEGIKEFPKIRKADFEKALNKLLNTAPMSTKDKRMKEPKSTFPFSHSREGKVKANPETLAPHSGVRETPG